MVNDNKNLIAKGIDPFIEVEKQKTALTFQEFADTQYLPHAKENKKSWRDDHRIIQNDMISVFGRYTLSAITKRDVQKYLDGITNRASGPTANRHRSLIMRMFHLAIEWDYLTVNPCLGIRKHRENPARELFLNPEEIGRLLAALDQIPQRVSACAVKFLIATGKRLKESMSLTWDNIDMEERIAYLHQDSTKGRKAERVILNALAIEILEELQAFRKAGNPNVFPGNGPGDRLVTPCKVYMTAKKAAGLNKKTRLHDLRHSFASNMLSCGASIYEVQKLLGHKDAAMTQRYAHLADNTLRER
ncbi:site-specific integrase, partial [bacterium]|nr:site-specific integrase [bacterium]